MFLRKNSGIEKKLKLISDSSRKRKQALLSLSIRLPPEFQQFFSPHHFLLKKIPPPNTGIHTHTHTHTHTQIHIYIYIYI